VGRVWIEQNSKSLIRAVRYRQGEETKKQLEQKTNKLEQKNKRNPRGIEDNQTMGKGKGNNHSKTMDP